MCRFAAFIGRKPLLLKSLVSTPTNSLIKQSREALEGNRKVNADGFGLGWYNLNLSAEPGIFRSIQPAWNDRNLGYLIEKVASTCFIGHVRACTVGEVGFYNCHPFHSEQFMFVHNGTVGHFRHYARAIIDAADDDAFNMIKGTTDSEIIFALFMTYYRQQRQKGSKEAIIDALNDTFRYVIMQQEKYAPDQFSRLNTIVTDGKRMLISRVGYHPEQETLTIYYQDKRDTELEGIIISAEKLDNNKDWRAIPENHSLMVDEDLGLELVPFHRKLSK